MPTVLISGANRGIGLEFARQYGRDDWDVIGTAREPGSADALRATGAEVLPLDIADPASIDALSEAVGNRAIDLLIANAGVYGENTLDAAQWAHVLAVNTIGPTLLADALRTNVSRSAKKAIVAITSGMGSISDNGSGGHIPYRSSKAALNAAWRSLAIDGRGDGIIAVVFNPGWVKTDMGGPNAAITPEQSVTAMRRVIDGLTLAESGRFWNYDGREYPLVT